MEKINRLFANRGNNRWENNGDEVLLRESIKTPLPPHSFNADSSCWCRECPEHNPESNDHFSIAWFGGAGGGLNTFLQPTWMTQKINIIEASPLSELSLDAFKFAACEF